MRKFRNVLLTAAIILIAAGAAFATNIAKNADGQSNPGYYIDNTSGQCLNAKKPCTTVVGDMCTWRDPATGIDYNLHQLVETSCGDFLYKIATP